MNEADRKRNIEVLFQAAINEEDKNEITAAEILYLEAAKQADRYLENDSPLRAKMLIACMDFYDSLGRDHDSEMMQRRLKVVAEELMNKIYRNNSILN